MVTVPPGNMGDYRLGVPVRRAALGTGPVGGGGHPPVVETHHVGMAAVVHGERHRVAPVEMLGEPQQGTGAGAAEAVEGLVLITHHADVAVGLGEPPNQLLLDVAGVLVLIADQVADAPGDPGGDVIVLQQPVGPSLQALEVGCKRRC